MVFSNFNGFEVDLSEAELRSLLKSKEVEQVFINLKFNADLPKPQLVESEPVQQKSGDVSPMNSDIVPPGVSLVWTTNPATAAEPNRTAWVLDTGCDLDHTDLNVDVARSISFVTGEPTAEDGNGHGTHVAGTIGAKYNDSGVVGVAPNARIVPVKVLGAGGGGSNASILAGLDYVENNAAPGDIVNMSIQVTVDNPSTVLDNAVTQVAENAGLFFSICAGNFKVNTANRPLARISHFRVYVVGATQNSSHTFAIDFPSGGGQGSNWGNNIVAAPGVNILSTYLNNGTHTLSGTSMAAPHVAGLMMYDIPCYMFHDVHLWRADIPIPGAFGDITGRRKHKQCAVRIATSQRLRHKLPLSRKHTGI